MSHGDGRFVWWRRKRRRQPSRPAVRGRRPRGARLSPSTAPLHCLPSSHRPAPHRCQAPRPSPPRQVEVNPNLATLTMNSLRRVFGYITVRASLPLPPLSALPQPRASPPRQVQYNNNLASLSMNNLERSEGIHVRASPPLPPLSALPPLLAPPHAALWDMASPLQPDPLPGLRSTPRPPPATWAISPATAPDRDGRCR